MRKNYGQRSADVPPPPLKPGDPDWSRKCCVCGERPTVYVEPKDPAPLCGPCTFGEAETAGGNW